MGTVPTVIGPVPTGTGTVQTGEGTIQTGVGMVPTGTGKFPMGVGKLVLVHFRKIKSIDYSLFLEIIKVFYLQTNEPINYSRALLLNKI